MNGYTRDPAVTAQLFNALADALLANPTQRLGQLLINITRHEDGSQSGLWNVHDEEWIKRLRKAAEPS